MSSIRVQLDNARRLFESAKYEQASELYSAIIVVDGNHAEAFNGRARCQYLIGQTDQALADLSRAIELSPKNASYHFARGRYCLESNRFQEACANFSAVFDIERGMQERPFWEAAAFFRAVANLELRRFEQALQDCAEIKEDFSLYVLGRVRNSKEVVRDAMAGLRGAGTERRE